MIPISQKYKNPRPVAFIKSMLFIVLFVALLMVSGFIRMFIPPMYSMLAYGILGTGAGLLTVWIALRMERQPFASIGLVWEKKTASRFLTGVLIGAAIFAVIITGLLFFTDLTLRYQAAAVNLQFILIYLAVLPLALMEEIGFRSYPQIKLYNTYGVWTSQVVIAIAFGAYHILNGWSPYVAFTDPFVWAFVFGLAALRSGGIAMPTGIHFAVNILQNVAGLKSGRGAIFKLDYPPGTTKALMAATEKTGTILQGVILTSALLLTALYVKGKKQQIN